MKIQEHTDLKETRSLNAIAHQLVITVRMDPKGRQYCLYRRYGTWRIHAMGTTKQIAADAANYYQGLAGIYSRSVKVEDVVEDMKYASKIFFEKRRQLQQGGDA